MSATKHQLAALNTLTTYIAAHDGDIPRDPNALVYFAMSRSDVENVSHSDAQRVIKSYRKNLQRLRQGKVSYNKRTGSIHALSAPSSGNRVVYANRTSRKTKQKTKTKTKKQPITGRKTHQRSRVSICCTSSHTIVIHEDKETEMEMLANLSVSDNMYNAQIIEQLLAFEYSEKEIKYAMDHATDPNDINAVRDYLYNGDMSMAEMSETSDDDSFGDTTSSGSLSIAHKAGCCHMIPLLENSPESVSASASTTSTSAKMEEVRKSKQEEAPPTSTNCVLQTIWDLFGSH